MRKKQDAGFRILILGALTIIFIVFEFVIMKQNSDVLENSGFEPFLIARQFSILFNASFSFVVGARGLYRTNVGYLIVYYAAIGFVVYRKAVQFHDVSINTIYMIQCVVLILTIMYYTHAAYSVFYGSFWLTFKFLGANKRVINAYIVRSSLKAFREVFFIDAFLVTLYVLSHPFSPGVSEEYRLWKIGYIPGFVITSYNEDNENTYRKVGDIVLWFGIFLELVLNRVVKSICRGKGSIAYEVYLCIILYIYTCLSTLDLLMYGSGLKDFNNRNKTRNIENE